MLQGCITGHKSWCVWVHICMCMFCFWGAFFRVFWGGWLFKSIEIPHSVWTFVTYSIPLATQHSVSSRVLRSAPHSRSCISEFQAQLTCEELQSISADLHFKLSITFQTWQPLSLWDLEQFPGKPLPPSAPVVVSTKASFTSTSRLYGLPPSFFCLFVWFFSRSLTHAFFVGFFAAVALDVQRFLWSGKLNLH